MFEGSIGKQSVLSVVWINNKDRVINSEYDLDSP